MRERSCLRGLLLLLLLLVHCYCMAAPIAPEAVCIGQRLTRPPLLLRSWHML